MTTITFTNSLMGWCKKNAIIDMIMTSCPDQMCETDVKPQSLSNHKAVSVQLSFKKMPSRHFKRLIYNYGNADWKRRKEDLSNKDWMKRDTQENNGRWDDT